MFSMNPDTLWFDDVRNANVGLLVPVNRRDRRRAARSGGKPSKGTRKDKRIKKNGKK
jgi:hypothetical protein